jgi:hypothetical protein
MPNIKTSYTEIWWPHPELDYEEEHGWVDEEGYRLESDPDDDECVVGNAVRFLQRAGTTEPSSSGYHKGLWYSWPGSEQDYRTGRGRTEASHLDGFTEEQERAVFFSMTIGRIGFFRD